MTTPLRIAVFGVGAVGGYVGAMLARRYHDDTAVDVTFVARGAHLDAIQRGGLRLATPGDDFVATPDAAVAQLSAEEPPDAVLVAVKDYGVEECARALSEVVDERTVVISLLNGLRAHAVLRRHLSRPLVLLGCVYIGGYIVEPGFVRQTAGNCEVLFGPRDDARARRIESVLTEADIAASCRDDIDVVAWKKLLCIAPIASVGLLEDETIGEVLGRPSSRELLEELMVEVRSLAGAHGVDLDAGVQRWAIDRLAGFPADTLTSLHRDWKRGHRTELDALAGWIHEEGTARGLELHHHAQLLPQLRAKIESSSPAG